MRPVAQTPTEAVDYATLTSAYGALLGAARLAARGREPLPRDEVPLLAAATFALSKLIVHEKVETWIRRPFVDEQASGRHPTVLAASAGSDMLHAAFSWLCAGANTQARKASPTQPTALSRSAA